MLRQPEETALIVRRALSGALEAQLLYVIAKLGIADLLAAGPRAAGDVADELGLHERSLYRTLRAAAAFGQLEHTPDDRFARTPVSDALREGVPGSLRYIVIMNGEGQFKAYGELLHTVRTGEPAFEHLFGRPAFEHMASDSDAAATFNRAMIDLTRIIAPQLVAAYDFSGIATIADVGGGAGTLLAEILKAHPAMSGILFDLAQGLEGAEALLEAEGVRDRVRIQAGSFFEAIPRADAIVMKHIVHDWDDEDAVRILANCRDALPDGGCVVLAERVMPERAVHPGSVQQASSDMVVLVMLNGRERTVAEFTELLARAGLTLTSVSEPTQSGMSVLEARR